MAPRQYDVAAHAPRHSWHVLVPVTPCSSGCVGRPIMGEYPTCASGRLENVRTGMQSFAVAPLSWHFLSAVRRSIFKLYLSRVSCRHDSWLRVVG